MFAAYVSVALLAVSSVSGLVVPRAAKQPANWWKGLESYTVYNARYNSFGCVNKHNTHFFDACCHPLSKGHTSLPAECKAASVSVTATATSAIPTETDDDDDCDDGPESSSATMTATSAIPTETDDDGDCDDGPESSTTLTATSAAPTTTDDGDDDCEPCDDDDPDNCEDAPMSSTVVSSTPAPTSAPVPSKPTSSSTRVTSTPAPTSTPVSSRPASSSTSVTTPASSSSSSKVSPSSTVTPTSSSTPALITAKPTPTPAKASATTSSPTPTASSPAAGSSTVSGGFATYFFQNGVAGACGDIHADDDLIAAIDERRYGNPGLKSKLCGQQVRVTNKKNNKSVVVTIKDDCPTCVNSNSIDLSQGAFKKIAAESDGMVDVSLTFL